jgi:hypothetical protein
MQLVEYDRRAAVMYAHEWAYGRNPLYYDYEDIGGDCTNFASQCLYAGSGIMNYTPTFGWYYLGADRKSPSWTGVPYFFNFLTRGGSTVGPEGIDSNPERLKAGDFVQLSFKGVEFQHTPIIVYIGSPATADNIFVAAHSIDCDYRRLSSYEYKSVRYIHVEGVYKP